MQVHNKPMYSTSESFETSGAMSAGDDRASPSEIKAIFGEHISPALHGLLSLARRTCHGASEVLYHEGSVSNAVYLVTSGFLKLIIHLPNGRARIVRLHRPGAVLCLSGLFDRNNKHTAVAVIPVTTLCLPVGAVQRLRTMDPLTYASLLERWHNYLNDADTWITQFSTGPIRARVARLLSFLSEFESDAENGELHLLTCEEMGSILGVTSESVSRVLAEFKRRDILSHHDGAANNHYEADMGRLRHIADE